jgi:glucosamine--fructose-6-phosphate aminotransferase (isomerizing)
VAHPSILGGALAATSDAPSSSSYRNGLLLLPALALAWGTKDNAAENCGIVGIVGDDHVTEHLLEGLTILQNRGYDSAGIASVNDSGSDLAITKYASRDSTADSINLVRKDSAKHDGHKTGLAHTRWATHGGKTDENAHPHTDAKDRIALVHNGTINNSSDLRRSLQSEGYALRSETDTEVIAILVGKYLDKGLPTKDALAQALSHCEGTWGIALINKSHPGEIVAACNGSPMVIGIGAGGKKYIASETSAFSKYTKNFISMKDGEITTVTQASTVDIRRMEEAPENTHLLTPHPHPHFTIKECLEQPEAIARALSYGARLNGDQVRQPLRPHVIPPQRTIHLLVAISANTRQSPLITPTCLDDY